MKTKTAMAVAGAVLAIFACSGTSACSVDGPWAGVIGYWRADANIEDLSGHMASEASPSVQLTRGIQGRAFSFDGASSINTALSLLTSPEQVTIAFWLRPDVANSMEYCCQGLVTTNGWGIEFSGGAHQRVGVNFFAAIEGHGILHTSDPNEGGALVPADAWTHIAGVYDGSVMQLYVNGEAWGAPTVAPGRLYPNYDDFLAIGSEDGRGPMCPDCVGTRYFDGDLDEVVVLGYAMEADEIGIMFQRGVLASIGHLNRPGIHGGSNS